MGEQVHAITHVSVKGDFSSCGANQPDPHAPDTVAEREDVRDS
jgi:hypothetical protein